MSILASCLPLGTAPAAHVDAQAVISISTATPKISVYVLLSELCVLLAPGTSRMAFKVWLRAGQTKQRRLQMHCAWPVMPWHGGSCCSSCYSAWLLCQRVWS